MFDQAANSLPQLRNRTIKAYAVTAKERLASAPDVPTVDEAGLPGFYISVWTALWAPAGTPKATVARLNAAVVEALANPAVRARLADLGQDIPPLRSADAGRARRAAKGGDREVVADHQGGQHQAGMSGGTALFHRRLRGRRPLPNPPPQAGEGIRAH